MVAFTKDEVRDIMEATEDAYSRGRYSNLAWKSNIVWLRKNYEVITVQQAIEVMNSKFTRWAADYQGNKNLRNALRDFKWRSSLDEYIADGCVG